MGRTKAEKLFVYVNHGNVLKVKSFLKKYQHDHRLDINAILPGRGYRQRTLLHIACASGDDAMMRMLLKYGAQADVQDSHGDTPLHLCIQRVLHGHKHAFEDLVLPILEKSCLSNLLDIANKRGRTSRQLLKEVAQMSQDRLERRIIELEEREEEEARRKEEAEWHSRLQDEWADDMAGTFGHNSSSDDIGYTGLSQESFDDWATRIAAEHSRKQQQQYYDACSECSHSRKQAEDREKRQEEKRNFQRKLEEEHEKYQRRRSERLRQKLARQKAHYLQRSGEVFGYAEGPEPTTELGFEDVPWPCCSGDAERMMQVLMCDVDKDAHPELKKFVRSQQLLWHPDKFLQKCGSRLVEADRARIMERVTQLSQALNQLVDDENTK